MTEPKKNETQLLIERITERGLSIEDIAVHDGIEVNIQTVYRWKVGKNNPGKRILKRLRSLAK